MSPTDLEPHTVSLVECLALCTMFLGIHKEAVARGPGLGDEALWKVGWEWDGSSYPDKTETVARTFS